MNPLVVVNFHRADELPKVARLSNIIGENFRGISNFEIPMTSWRFDSMRKFDVEWTKRFLRRFLEETQFDCLVKIDPDTKLKGHLPLPENRCDVAGDFRYYIHGWVWFGGYHFFTRRAVEILLNDPLYSGISPIQDMPLTQAVVRNHLTALNMADVNCCRIPFEPKTIVSHPARYFIPRLPPGIIDFNMVSSN